MKITTRAISSVGIWLMLVILLTPLAAFCDPYVAGHFLDNDLHYNSYSDHARVNVSGLKNQLATDIVIPETVVYVYSKYDSKTKEYITQYHTYNVVAISSSAFENCDGLTSVTIPDSITSIGAKAFLNCDGLTSVTIPDSVTSIGKHAFCGCSGLTSVTIGNGVKSMGKDAFSFCASLTSVTIDDGVKSIGENAFWCCSSLTSVTIPESVKSIGAAAFYNCSALASVTIGDGVTSIGEYAFENCSALTSVTIGDGVTNIGRYAFRDCSGLKSVMIPDGVTNIGNYAFYNCSGLTSVTIPDGVTSIGSCAFYGCSGLTSVTIPNSVTNIGTYAFYNCSALTSVTIDGGVTSIGDYAFSSCSALTSVTIGDGVTKIGGSAFMGCKNVNEFNFLGAPPTSPGMPFQNTKSDAIGTYTMEHEAEWKAVIDSRGYWKGLKMRSSYYTVHYDLNGGGGEIVDEVVEYGSGGIKIEAHGVSWEGCYLVGWAFEPDGEVVYVDGDSVAEPTGNEDNVTLYAKWMKLGKAVLSVDGYDAVEGSLQLSWTGEDANLPEDLTYEIRRGFSDDFDAAEVLTNGYEQLSYVDRQFDFTGGVSRIWYWVKPEDERFAASEPCVTKNRYGVSIGFSRYSGSLSGLKGMSSYDAVRARQVALEKGGFELECMTDFAASGQNLLRKIEDLSKIVKPGDVLLFHIATHGYEGESTQEPMIALYNCWLTYLELQDLARLFYDKQCRFVGIIMACHSLAITAGGHLVNNSFALQQMMENGLGACSPYVAWIVSAEVEESSWRNDTTGHSEFSDVFWNYGWNDGYCDSDLCVGGNMICAPEHYDTVMTLLEAAEYAKHMMVRSHASSFNDTLLRRIVIGKAPQALISGVLGAPQNVVAHEIMGAKIEWDAVPSAERYILYRYVDNPSNAVILDSNVKDTQYGVSGGLIGWLKGEKYFVKAANRAGISVSSLVGEIEGNQSGVGIEDIENHLSKSGINTESLSEKDIMQAANADISGNGLTVWQEYVAGVSSTDKDAKFCAMLTFEDGQPKVSWTPELSPEEAERRVYTTLGKVSLEDPDWTPIDDNVKGYNFFKVSVEMKQ